MHPTPPSPDCHTAYREMVNHTPPWKGCHEFNIVYQVRSLGMHMEAREKRSVVRFGACVLTPGIVL